MQIELARPTELDFLNKNVNFRTVYKNVFQRIDNLGILTTEKLERLLEEEEDGLGEEYSYLCDETERRSLQKLYDEWVESFVFGWENFHEIKSYTLPREVFGTNKKGIEFKLRNTIGMHIFYELSRLRCLVTYKEMMREKRLIFAKQTSELQKNATKRKFKSLFSISATLHSMWGEITQFVENVIQNLLEEKREREKKVSGYIDPYLISLRQKKKVHSEEQKEDEEEIQQMRNLLEQMQVLYNKPVFQYTQTEIVMALKFLSYYINDIPTIAIKMPDYNLDATGKTLVTTDAVYETRMFFDALFTRNSLFFCEAMTENELNDEDLRTRVIVTSDRGLEKEEEEEEEEEEEDYYQPNRLYTAFTSFYMGVMLRRFYYYDQLKDNRFDLLLDFDLLEEDLNHAAKKLENWLLDIAKKMPEESIMDIYADVCDEVYNFPGDDRFFTFKYPRKVRSTVAYLQWMRPALAKQFHAEGNVSIQSIFSSVHRSHVSRFFIICLLNTYLKIQRQIKWMGAVLVNNTGFELSSHRLMANICPLLVQPLSRYWAYDGGKVYQCDSIYESISIWFLLLKTRYNSKLHGVGLEPFIKIIWPDQQRASGIDAESNQVIGTI